MSKGKKHNTPKKHWNNIGRTKKYTAHVMGEKHNKFKWFFRCKKWFKDNAIKKMAMKFPTSHEIWGWD